MQKRIYLILFSIFLNINIFIYSSPQIILDTNEVVFDNVEINQKVSKTLKIINNGDSVLKILSVRSSCNCLWGGVDIKDIKPSHFSNLTITLDTKGLSGEKKYFIMLETNDYKNSLMKIYIKLKIKSINAPVIEVFPDEINFNLLGKKIAKARLIIKNLGEKELKCNLFSSNKVISFNLNNFIIDGYEQNIIEVIYNSDVKDIILQDQFILIKNNSINQKEIKIPYKIK